MSNTRLQICSQPASPTVKVYRISWHNDRSHYITESTGGRLIVAEKDNAQQQFWRFIPVEGKTDTYYVQNTATQRYIASCNKPASSASRMSTTETPIPYYVAHNATAQAKGAWYMSSTDCPNYDQPAKSPKGLNKDGASENIIVWPAGNANPGSYWWLEETEDLYELRPFETGAQHLYALLNEENETLAQQPDGTLYWKRGSAALAEGWYFDGNGNKQGGYTIINGNTGNAIYNNTHYIIRSSNENGFYQFSTSDGTPLEISDSKLFRFRALRSPLARRLQIYDLPCTTSDKLWVKDCKIEGAAATTPLHYPDTRTQPSKAGAYTLFTRSRAVLLQGKEAVFSATLNKAPAAGTTAYLYFDWDRDGIFETSQVLNIEQQLQTSFTVPANARIGESRLRLRVTINGENDADDETVGLVFDGVVRVIKAPTGVNTTHIRAAKNVRYDLSGRLIGPSEGQFLIISDNKITLHP